MVGYKISKSQLGIFCNGDKASWGGVEAIHEIFLEIRIVFIPKISNVGKIQNFGGVFQNYTNVPHTGRNRSKARNE